MIYIRRCRIASTFFLVTLGTIGALVPVRSQADAATEQWEWGATVYLWLPSLNGETSFPPGEGGPSIDVTTEQILDSLNFVFMATVDGRKGSWGVATDVIYLDFGASEKATRDFGIGHVDIPVNVTANLGLDVTGWLWTLEGSYTVADEDSFALHALAGARLLVLEENLDWVLNGDISSLPLLNRSGSARAKRDQWDAILGVKGHGAFGAERRWYIPYYIDIGTGESDLTWQATLGLGYRFHAIDVLGVWRYLDYDLGDGTSLDFNGPAFGVKFRF